MAKNNQQTTIKDCAKELRLQVMRMCCKNGTDKPKFKDDFDIVLKDMFGKKKLVDKITKMSTYPDSKYYYKRVMSDFPSEKLLAMLLSDQYNAILRKTVIATHTFRNDDGEATASERQKQEKIIKSAIKQLKKVFGIKSTNDWDDFGWDDFKDLKEFGKGRKSRDYWDDDWDEFDDDTAEDSYEAENMVSALKDIFRRGSVRTNESSADSLKDALQKKIKRQSDLGWDDDEDDNDYRFDDDDDDDDEDDIDAAAIVSSVKNEVGGMLKPIMKSINTLSQRIDNLDNQAVYSVPRQTRPVNPAPAPAPSAPVNNGINQQVISQLNALTSTMNSMMTTFGEMGKNITKLNKRLDKQEAAISQMADDIYSDDDEDNSNNGPAVTADDLGESWSNSGAITDVPQEYTGNIIRLKDQ